MRTIPDPKKLLKLAKENEEKLKKEAEAADQKYIRDAADIIINDLIGALDNAVKRGNKWAQISTHIKQGFKTRVFELVKNDFANVSRMYVISCDAVVTYVSISIDDVDDVPVVSKM